MSGLTACCGASAGQERARRQRRGGDQRWHRSPFKLLLSSMNLPWYITRSCPACGTSIPAPHRRSTREPRVSGRETKRRPYGAAAGGRPRRAWHAPAGHFSSARSFNPAIVSLGSTSTRSGEPRSGPSSFTWAGMRSPRRASGAAPVWPPRRCKRRLTLTAWRANRAQKFTHQK